MTATVKSNYSTVQIVESQLGRRMFVSTPLGNVQIASSPGELPKLVVMHDKIGFAELPLDDNAVEALAYELADYLAKKRRRLRAQIQQG